MGAIPVIPDYLLISTCNFYKETNSQGTFGEQTQQWSLIGSARVRLDQSSSSRTLEGGRYEQTGKRFMLFTNQLPPDVDEKTWVAVTAVNGYKVTGQVQSVTYPGLMGHHAELVISEYLNQDII